MASQISKRISVGYWFAYIQRTVAHDGLANQTEAKVSEWNIIMLGSRTYRFQYHQVLPQAFRTDRGHSRI